MPKILPRNRSLRIAVVLGVLVVFLAGGWAGAWYIARPMYKNWRERRANEVARELFQKGDYPNAILAVRKTLGYNQNNIDAWKLAVDITDKQGVPDVVFYQQHLAQVQPSFENRLRFLQLAVKFHAYKEAEKTLNLIGAEGGKSPEFLDLAAQISRHTGNPTKAKYYLMSLVSLQPNNNKAKFDLAQLRLVDGVAENKPSIRAEIRNLATDPELRPRALALLLSDSLQAQNSSEALELADTLSADQNVPPPSYILVLDAYRRYASGRFKALLQKLETDWANNSDNVIILTNYLIGNGEAAETRRWYESLSEKVRGVEGVQLTYAYALLTLKDFDALETFLKSVKWDQEEYARDVLLAYRYRAAGRDREFNEAWKSAVIEVGNNVRRIQTLLAQVSNWGWQEEKYELLWKFFMIEPQNQVARNQLIIRERNRGNTAALNRLFARIIELDPNDRDSRNNYAYTSLLLGINQDRAYQAAADDYRSNPRNPYYATTQALALYRQGKYAEALDLMQNLGIASVTVPERALLDAVLLIANGKFEEGSNMMMSLKRDGFLPEEKRLMDDGLAMLDKSRQEQGNAARLAALTASNTGGADRKSWLHDLPAELQKAPTVPMELADSLYSNDDYKGLEAALRSDKWDDREFLRLALLAYAQRQQDRPGSISHNNWIGAIALAGSSPVNLSALADMARRWGWTSEYIDVISKLFQRDPSDTKAFNELTEYFSKSNQTGDLARVFQQRLEAVPDDADAKSRFAYYSLLTNTNVSRAYLLAKEAYDNQPSNEFRAKVYAFALYKQSRAVDGWELVDKLGDQKETGPLQLSLVKAALAAQQNQVKAARALLGTFDPTSALPEETALADSIAKSLEARDS